MKKLIALLLLLLVPSLALAGSWDNTKINANSTATFTWVAADTGDQTALDATECSSAPTIVATVPSGTPPSVGLFLGTAATSATTTSTLAVTVTATGDYSSVQAGQYFLRPNVATAGNGGSIVVRCGPTGSVATEAGLRWVSGTALQTPLGGLKREVYNSALGSSTSAGYDYWFCDFNDALDFSLSSSGTFNSANGLILPAESQPFVTATANATAPNLNNFWRWARTDVGAAATQVGFYSNRAAGISDELHSSVIFGNAAGDTSKGFFAYQPFMSLGLSTTSLIKEFGIAARVALSGGSRQTAVFYVGTSSLILGGATIPLTTAGALDASVGNNYFGFYIDASSNIKVVMNKSNVTQFTFDTGFNMTSSFSVLEMRGALINDGASAWTGGFIDCYVNGIPVVATAGRKHCIEPADVAWSPSPNPQHLSMGYVHTAGGQTSAFRVDYVGMMHSRVLGQ